MISSSWFPSFRERSKILQGFKSKDIKCWYLNKKPCKIVGLSYEKL